MPRRLALIVAIARKDWSLFWADRRAAAFAFLVPIVLASVFGMIFERPASSDNVQLSVLIVVENESPFTRLVVNDLLSGTRFEAQEATLADAERSVAERRPGLAIVIPRGFERLANWSVDGDAPKPQVRILHHPMCGAERQWAGGAFTEIVMKRIAREKLGGLLAGDLAMTAPFEVLSAAVDGPRAFNSYSHSFSGMTLQYLLFWGMESGLLLLRERQRGVWSRLRAAPVPLGVVLLGKATATAGIALLQVLATFTFGHVVFGVNIGGSFLGFVALALAICALSAATGLLVAAIGGTEARARSVCILAILGVSLLGGLWMPAFLLPGWLRDVSFSLPTTWAMRGLEAVTWQGRGFSSVLPSIAVVAGFTLVFLVLAIARLRADCPARLRPAT